MLNKEDILALAWEYSEGSGKRYTFTEESLLEMMWVALSHGNHSPRTEDLQSIASTTLKTITPEDVPAYVWGESERRYYADGYNTAIARYVTQQTNKV